MKPTSMIVIVLLLVLTVAVSAQNQAPWMEGSRTGEALVIKLVTIEPGSDIYAWWGHSGLIVEDRQTGASRFYDYGRFSFQQEHFYTNFIQGRLLFEVGAAPTRAYLEHYRNLNRTVRIQTLSLPPDRRLALARFLERNILPDNRVYLYDHYYDNCATRLRDLLDEATGGALSEAGSEMAGVTFREITRKYTQHLFVMDFLLMYLMSDVIDVEMSVWETMFLPEELETVASGIVYETGTRRYRLVAGTTEFNRAEGRRTIPETAPPLWPPSLWIGIGFGLLCLAAGAVSLIRNRLGLTALGIGFVILGAVSGILGSLLFFMSQFTDHAVTYGNENLVFTNPICLALIVAGSLVIRRKRLSVHFAFYLLGTITLIIALFALAKLVFPALNQDNWPQIALFGSAYLLTWTGVAIPFIRQVRNRLANTSEA